MDRKLARKNIRSGLIAGAAACSCSGSRSSPPRSTSTRERMTRLSEQPPPVGEEIHLPGPSLLPLLSAIGITLTIVGTTLSLIISAIGLIILIVTTVIWIRNTRRDIDELPEEHH